MTYDDGLITIYTLAEVEEPGDMPKEQLVKHSEHLFGERTVGYGRQYAAKGVNEQVDKLVRFWEDRTIRIGMYAIIGDDPSDGEQFRIDNVQHLKDEDGLKVTDLSLRRLDELYEIDEKQIDTNP